jgi:hypothetical protein
MRDIVKHAGRRTLPSDPDFEVTFAADVDMTGRATVVAVQGKAPGFIIAGITRGINEAPFKPATRNGIPIPGRFYYRIKG